MKARVDGSCREVEAEAGREGPHAVGDPRAKELKDALIRLLLTRRRELQLTQAALSVQSGVAQTEISRIERGRKSPTIDTYSRLASALGLQWSLGAWSTTPLQGREDDLRPLRREPARPADGTRSAEPD